MTGGSEKGAVNIYGIDIDIKKEENEAEIRVAMGRARTDPVIEVKAIRPMMESRQAATVVAGQSIIRELLGKSTIRIGLSMVNIKERKDIITFVKCWEEKHLARNCSGRDRKLLCRNCSEEGHKVSLCKSRP